MHLVLHTLYLDSTIRWIKEKFSKKEDIMEANILALNSGRNFAETIGAIATTYTVAPAKIAPGTYRQINGNTATAWGLIHASQVSNRELFLGTYPITPATDILHELTKHKNFGLKTFQAEDEIAGVSSAIGASFGGALSVTTTSGPGLALKGEAMGLAIMYETPLVIINVQRGGPSTGLPTKTEQSDLLQAMYGRNGDCPMIVIAAANPSDCFNMAYEAVRLTLEHMTPVILLTDGYIANGSEPWLLPDLTKKFNKIKTHLINEKSEMSEGEKYSPYIRDENLVRKWAIPGIPGYEHRLGGLEKQIDTGNVSYDPQNHEMMTSIRAGKVAKVADNIPLLKVEGDDVGDILVVSWGGTYGSVCMAVKELREDGKKVSHVHLKYLNPFPKNLREILGKFNKILVPELNNGQLLRILNAEFGCNAAGYNKIQGLPFKISELVGAISKEL